MIDNLHWHIKKDGTKVLRGLICNDFDYVETERGLIAEHGKWELQEIDLNSLPIKKD